MAKNTVRWTEEHKAKADPREAYTQEQVGEALMAAGGVQIDAARILGCSRSTLNGYVKRYPALQEVIATARDEALDIAESQLLKKVKDGNMTAIIFFLKTQGKRRGYVERGEVPAKEDEFVDMSSQPTEELEKLGAELATQLNSAKPPRLYS